MLDNARRCADLFGCPVGVEGHYPSQRDDWLVSNWQEYRAVFASGVPPTRSTCRTCTSSPPTGRPETTLVAEMLACERCIEVHLSANDGRGDWHEVCTEDVWWHALLPHPHPRQWCSPRATTAGRGPTMRTEDLETGATYLVGADGHCASLLRAPMWRRYPEVLAHPGLGSLLDRACLARLFRQHAWLDAVTLSFSVTAEYDDSGGYYRCVRCHAETVRAVPGTVLDDAIFPGGEFDADHAAELIREEIEDDEFDLYTGLAGTPDGYEDLDLPLERSAVAELLSRAIDGRSWRVPPGACPRLRRAS